MTISQSRNPVLSRAQALRLALVFSGAALGFGAIAKMPAAEVSASEKPACVDTTLDPAHFLLRCGGDVLRFLKTRPQVLAAYPRMVEALDNNLAALGDKRINVDTFLKLTAPAVRALHISATAPRSNMNFEVRLVTADFREVIEGRLQGGNTVMSTLRLAYD